MKQIITKLENSRQLLGGILGAIFLSAIALTISTQAATPSISSEPPEFESSFGKVDEYGDPEDFSSTPYGQVSVSPDGAKLYVPNIDWNNRSQVKVYDTANNSYLGYMGSDAETPYNGPAGLSQPYDTALSPDGTKLYVADSNNHRIQVFNTTDYSHFKTIDGNCEDAPYEGGYGDGTFCYPQGLAVSPDGKKVYVTDDNSGLIKIFDTESGLHLGKIGYNDGDGSPYTNGYLAYPSGLAFSPDGTKLYVANSGNNNIQIFNTANGSFIASIGAEPEYDGQIYSSSAEGEFSYPQAVSLSPDGTKLYVADTQNSRIQVFNTGDNSFVTQFGYNEDDPYANGALYEPRAVMPSSDGQRVYVAGGSMDYNLPRIVQVFRYPNQVILKGAETGKSILLQTPSGTSLTCSSTAAGTSLTAQDTNYSYPLGLVEFCFNTPATDNEVSLTFVTDLQPNQVVARKYNSETNTYTDITGASITQATYMGQPALQLTYTIADNGPLDLDTDTGAIKDPVGLGVSGDGTTSGSGSLASTGTSQQIILLVAGMATLGSVLYISHNKLGRARR